MHTLAAYRFAWYFLFHPLDVTINTRKRNSVKRFQVYPVTCASCCGFYKAVYNKFEQLGYLHQY